MKENKLNFQICADYNRRYTATPLEKLRGRIPPLKVGDIVLVRHKRGGLTRKFLRYVTNSYWDHAAMVLFPREPERAHRHTIIVEALQIGPNTSLRHGVNLHLLDKYLRRPDRYDVGICRLSWLNKKDRKRIRTYMLLNLDTPYYPLSFFKFLLARLFKGYRRNFLLTQRYSCSGLIQKVLYEAVELKDRRKIFFKTGFTPIQTLDVVAPADIAKSHAVEWVWNKHV